MLSGHPEAPGTPWVWYPSSRPGTLWVWHPRGHPSLRRATREPRHPQAGTRPRKGCPYRSSAD